MNYWSPDKVEQHFIKTLQKKKKSNLLKTYVLQHIVKSVCGCWLQLEVGEKVGCHKTLKQKHYPDVYSSTRFVSVSITKAQFIYT